MGQLVQGDLDLGDEKREKQKKGVETQSLEFWGKPRAVSWIQGRG